jgi:hypothetical protein
VICACTCSQLSSARYKSAISPSSQLRRDVFNQVHCTILIPLPTTYRHICHQISSFIPPCRLTAVKMSFGSSGWRFPPRIVLVPCPADVIVTLESSPVECAHQTCPWVLDSKSIITGSVTNLIYNCHTCPSICMLSPSCSSRYRISLMHSWI